jgi:hypothetical protein
MSPSMLNSFVLRGRREKCGTFSNLLHNSFNAIAPAIKQQEKIYSIDF